jgi:hypothetical protein
LAFDQSISKHQPKGDSSVVGFGINNDNSYARKQAVDMTWGPGARVERFASSDAVNERSFTDGTGQAGFQRPFIPAAYDGSKTNFYATAAAPGESSRSPIPQQLSGRSDLTLSPQNWFQKPA